jgi:hypothetical protein
MSSLISSTSTTKETTNDHTIEVSNIWKQMQLLIDYFEQLSMIDGFKQYSNELGVPLMYDIFCVTIEAPMKIELRRLTEKQRFQIVELYTLFVSTLTRAQRRITYLTIDSCRRVIEIYYPEETYIKYFLIGFLLHKCDIQNDAEIYCTRAVYLYDESKRRELGSSCIFRHVQNVVHSIPKSARRIRPPEFDSYIV